jgi:hypothetical protein
LSPLGPPIHHSTVTSTFHHSPTLLLPILLSPASGCLGSTLLNASLGACCRPFKRPCIFKHQREHGGPPRCCINLYAYYRRRHLTQPLKHPLVTRTPSLPSAHHSDIQHAALGTRYATRLLLTVAASAPDTGGAVIQFCISILHRCSSFLQCLGSGRPVAALPSLHMHGVSNGSRTTSAPPEPIVRGGLLFGIDIRDPDALSKDSPFRLLAGLRAHYGRPQFVLQHTHAAALLARTGLPHMQPPGVREGLLRSIAVRSNSLCRFPEMHTALFGARHPLRGDGRR